MADLTKFSKNKTNIFTCYYVTNSKNLILENHQNVFNYENFLKFTFSKVEITEIFPQQNGFSILSCFSIMHNQIFEFDFNTTIKDLSNSTNRN